MSDPFANSATFDVHWTDGGVAQVTSLSLGPPLAPIDPTLPMVMLLHGLGGDIHHMAEPGQSPGLNFDLDAPAAPPPYFTPRDWHPYPNLGFWSIGLDPLKTVTGWQTALNRAGFRTFNYAQLDPNGQIKRPVRELDFVVQAVLAACRKRLAFVCHSRGGLVLRQFLQSHRGDDAVLSRIAGAITLHTPHQGSQVADFAVGIDNFLTDAGRKVPVLSPCLNALDKMLGVGEDGIAELSPTSTVLTNLAAAEGGQPLVPIHTFGGTNPRLTKVRLSIFSPTSAIPMFHIPPFLWVTIEAKIGALEQLGAGAICPEEDVGGDVLVTDARSHLPGEASHHSNPLNHAAVLFAESLFDQVNPILRSFVISNAVWAGQNMPQVVDPGASVHVQLTMRNTGATTWTSGGNHPFRLAAVNPEENMTWGRNRCDLPGPVPPGAQVTFDFWVTAPAAPGGYVFQWQMLQENIEWIGTPSPATNVQVSAPVRSVSVTPNVVPAGRNPTGAVELVGPPHFGSGQVVTLTSSDPTAIVLQYSVLTFSPDQAYRQFNITTNPVTTTKTVNIIASGGGRTVTAALTIQPPEPVIIIRSFVLNPSTSVTSGGQITGTVTLSGPTPSLGEIITFTSSAYQIAPAAMTIPGGASVGMWSTRAGSVSVPTQVSIAATPLGPNPGPTQTAWITLNPFVAYSVPPSGSASVTGGIGGRII